MRSLFRFPFWLAGFVLAKVYVVLTMGSEAFGDGIVDGGDSLFKRMRRK